MYIEREKKEEKTKKNYYKKGILFNWAKSEKTIVELSLDIVMNLM